MANRQPIGRLSKLDRPVTGMLCASTKKKGGLGFWLLWSVRVKNAAEVEIRSRVIRCTLFSLHLKHQAQQHVGQPQLQVHCKYCKPTASKYDRATRASLALNLSGKKIVLGKTSVVLLMPSLRTVRRLIPSCGIYHFPYVDMRMAV